jgi:uncharacterized protein
LKLAFVDTSGWMMLADGADREHGAASEWRDRWLEAGGYLVSTDYVVDETLTLLRMRLGLDVAEAWWHNVESSRRVRWEGIDSPRAERARAWLFRWHEHDFSFTDCTSFVVMRELRLRQVLASNRHFRIAGFDMQPGSTRGRRPGRGPRR